MHNCTLQIAMPLLDVIDDSVTRAAGVSLRMLRLDKVHPLLSGNKWYKLRLNLEAARHQGHTTVLSFGGAYSNHLHALAAAGNLFGFRTIGVVRGELTQPLNPTLAFCREQGMELHAISRTEYRSKTDGAFLAELTARFGDFFLVPEGGANTAGVLGCTDIVRFLQWSSHSRDRHVMLACGTGATLAGMLAGLTVPCQITGFSVLKGGEFLTHRVQEFLHECGAADPGQWQINTDWHFGGYGRVTNELLEFIRQFTRTTGIPLEPVYTGKMMFGLYSLLAQGGIASGSEIIAIHSGGLQGWNDNVVNIPT
ncbi:MAG: pyridoxal-phosphate dependent enzyme [Gammaproteobacteria bacterium]|nr:pyridoxal-phosphate dependent enzyme [Gammaproteobacteria bacterium]